MKNFDHPFLIELAELFSLRHTDDDWRLDFKGLLHYTGRQIGTMQRDGRDVFNICERLDPDRTTEIVEMIVEIPFAAGTWIKYICMNFYPDNEADRHMIDRLDEAVKVYEFFHSDAYAEHGGDLPF